MVSFRAAVRPEMMPRVSALSLFIMAIVSSTIVASCVFLDVPEQQQRLAAAWRIQGTVQVAPAPPHAIVVLLLRKVDSAGDALPSWKIVDHFVLDRSGPWVFATDSGTSRVAAFQDSNSDVVYQPGEPFVATSVERPIACSAGAQIKGIVISIPAQPTERFDREVDVISLQALSADERAERTLGQLTAVGEVTTLADPRFDLTKSPDGLWRPYDYMLTSHPGVYSACSSSARLLLHWTSTLITMSCCGSASSLPCKGIRQDRADGVGGAVSWAIRFCYPARSRRNLDRGQA